MKTNTKQQQAGRPAGTKNPGPKERIQRKVESVYGALLNSALGGNPEACRICLDIVKNPAHYPDVPTEE